ncbi:MAG TPA: FAD-dependent monooxygenase [Candidatus Eisenbacteria bacterium]|nr:FAD-dependent monooxygenase [Candidatus Eisenbacteria bacterium]
MSAPALDALIVGAGPTGLALAAQLARLGARFRIVDRSFDRARESRALGVQARTLECLDQIGLADPLVACGRTGTRVAVHLGARRVAGITLGDVRATDTRYPFILFVSQAETERLLNEHLASAGVTVERGVELTGFAAADAQFVCTLRHAGGDEERAAAAYLVGCDGAHSSVRNQAGFAFEGGSYPQDFALGDVEADGPLEPGAINAFAAGGGIAMLFPLGRPTTWRVIAMATERAHDMSPPASPATAGLTLAELQRMLDAPTGGTIRVRDPAWLTRFHLHHRQVGHYRAGRVFLAGDAAHIHSPVGAQGMNTGIQDAWNLGWKLALVSRGAAREPLLDTYELERWPVGRFLLRYTDRIFGLVTRAMSAGPVASWGRELIVPRVLPAVGAASWLRSAAFRFVSELAIRYRRSPLAEEGVPRLHGGPRAGDRLPDARLTLDGEAAWLQRVAAGPRFTLLRCEDARVRDERADGWMDAHRDVLEIRRLSSRATPGALVDTSGDTLKLLGADRGAHYLIRPDGYVGYRAAGPDLEGVRAYLDRWLIRGAP